MKSRTCLIVLFSIFCLSETLFAGIGACHDGAGNITAFEKDANHTAFNGSNCEYYHPPHNIMPEYFGFLQGIQPKYLKWDGKPVEMTQAEKDAVDAAEEAERQDREDARWNAMIDRAKEKVDSPDTEASLIQECVSLSVVAPEIRNIKAGSPGPSKSDQELKNAVKSCLEGKKK